MIIIIWVQIFGPVHLGIKFGSTGLIFRAADISCPTCNHWKPQLSYAKKKNKKETKNLLVNSESNVFHPFVSIFLPMTQVTVLSQQGWMTVDTQAMGSFDLADQSRG